MGTPLELDDAVVAQGIEPAGDGAPVDSEVLGEDPGFNGELRLVCGREGRKAR